MGDVVAIALAIVIVLWLVALFGLYGWGVYCMWRTDRATERAVDAGILGNQYASARFIEEAEKWSRRDVLARLLGRETTI